jgi:acetyl esterase/lipase
MMKDLTRRELAWQGGALAVGVAFSGLSSSLTTAAFGQSPLPSDIIKHVHPELRSMLPRLLSMPTSVLTAETLAKSRVGALGYSFPPLSAPAWSERTIPGPKGAPDVRIFIVNAKARRALRPAILHMHGGGFVIGAAKTGIRALQEIAQALDCVIVTVDYRLAPETRFEGSLEDNYAALKWLDQHAAELGGDRSRIAVMGESAGGGHAAMLAIAARDRGEIPILYQALIYPMLDDRTGSTVQKPSIMGAILWTPASNRFGWTSFLGVPAGAKHVPKGAVPARLENLAGLPPAFIGVGSIDLFVDEDIDYARRLIDSGVPTELHVVPGAFHGFDGIPGTTIGPRFRASLIEALRQAFASKA